MNNFSIGDDLVITYNLEPVCAFWESGGSIIFHRWEYYHGKAPNNFDITLSANKKFDVCKIVGVDDFGTL